MKTITQSYNAVYESIKNTARVIETFDDYIKNAINSISQNSEFDYSARSALNSNGEVDSIDGESKQRILKVDTRNVTMDSLYAIEDALRIMGALVDAKSTAGMSVEQVKSIGIRAAEFLRDAGLADEAKQLLSYITNYNGAAESLANNQIFLDLNATLYQKAKRAAELKAEYDNYIKRTTVVTSEGTQYSKYSIQIVKDGQTVTINTLNDPADFLEALTGVYSANSR